MTNGDIDKAIKHFKCVRDGAMVVLNTGFGTHEGEHDTVYRNRIKYADMAISALEHDRWIPVTESPKNDDTYLVTMDGEICGQEEPITSMCGYFDGNWDEDYVLAWRPLPEPYHPQKLNYADADTAQCGLQSAT